MKHSLFHLIIPILSVSIFLTGCEESPPPRLPVSQLYSQFTPFGSHGTTAGNFNKPRSLAVDGQDILHIVDMTGRVQRWNTDGKYLDAWQAPETDKGRPKGMGVDQDGHLILVEPHYKRVTHFDFTGHPVRTWGKEGAIPGQLQFPRAAACDPQGNIFICEYLQVQRIQKFKADGSFIKTWGKEGMGPGEFRRPEGLAVDSHGNVYVADSCNHRIQKFSNDGHFLLEFGKPGTALGELSYPYDVKITPGGQVVVCEFGNSRIQVFSPQGQPIEFIGEPGTGDWQFRNPWALAMDRQGNLWVADSMNHRVVRLKYAGASS